MTDTATDGPFFHDGTREIRFTVLIDGAPVWASVGSATLRFHFRPTVHVDDAMMTFAAHVAEIEAAVRRRITAGARPPVMLREADLRVADAPAVVPEGAP